MDKVIVLLILLSVSPIATAQTYEKIAEENACQTLAQKERKAYELKCMQTVVDSILFDGDPWVRFMGKDRCSGGYSKWDRFGGDWSEDDCPQGYFHKYVYRKDDRRRICCVCRRHEKIHLDKGIDEYSYKLRPRLKGDCTTPYHTWR